MITGFQILGISMASYSELKELIRRIEFNNTESEVLIKLIESAIETGERVTKDNNELVQIAKNVSKKMMKKKNLREVSDNKLHSNNKIIAIDGSSFPIEGISGRYYVPFSAVAIEFPNGIGSKARMVFDAIISPFDASDEGQLNRDISLTMLGMETKLIQLQAENISRDKLTIIMIDGPIVDPPNIIDNEYILIRCTALKSCLNEGALIVGIVKSPKDQFFCRYFEDEHLLKVACTVFKNDFFLMGHVFLQARKEGNINSTVPLRTTSLLLSDKSAIMEKYKDQSIFIWSFFYQESKTGRPLRIDWCTTKDLSQDKAEAQSDNIAQQIHNVMYPGIIYPLPVYLAHKKCSIKQGCAEVLYYDIITRSRTLDDNSLILEILRGGF